MDVQRRTLDGCDVAVVTVQPASDPPVRYDGRVWVRVGPTVRQAAPSGELRLAERRRGHDVSFDLRPRESAEIADLDMRYIEREYLPASIAADVLDENQRSLEDQMRSLRLLTGDRPTNGALLAFGRDPQRWLPGAYVQFVRFEGGEITDPIRSQATLGGQLADVLNGISRLLEVNIESPGGLFGRVTPEQLGRGATDYRNQLIAETMHNLGFAQRFGYGIPLALRTLAENGNPTPEFNVDHNRVLVTVRPAR